MEKRRNNTLPTGWNCQAGGTHGRWNSLAYTGTNGWITLFYGFNIPLGVKKLQKLSLRFAPLEVKADSSAKWNLPYTCAIGFNFLARFSGR